LSNRIILDLVVPRLFGSAALIEEGRHSGRYPLLEKFLSRASREATGNRDFPVTLLELFGIPLSPGAETPVAPFLRLAEGGDIDQTFWMVAAPVHLRADRNRLLLFDSDGLDFSQAQAADLAGVFSEHFREQGWRLEAPSPCRWYLGLDHAPKITTSHLDQVLGQHIDPFLPRGPDARRWHGILNEVQMLFHSAEVNSCREERGLIPINSLWFYGGGRFIPPDGGEYGVVCTDSSLAEGLASAAGIARAGLQGELMVDLPERGRALLITESLQRAFLNADAEGWFEGLGRLERLMTELQRRLKSGALSEVNIHTCDGSIYRIDNRRLRRFWKRVRPLVPE
jgi:hypothetical protein